MPLARVPLTGTFDVAMANVSLENKTTFDNSASGVTTSFTFNELNVQGLPSLMYWIRLDSAVPGVTWNPFFSITASQPSSCSSIFEHLPHRVQKKNGGKNEKNLFLFWNYLYF